MLYEKSLLDYAFPPIDYSLLENASEKLNLLNEELNYDQKELMNILAKVDLLNVNQKAIYNCIVNALDKKIDQSIFFVDGSEGYGKTFLFNMILVKVRLFNCYCRYFVRNCSFTR